MQTMISISKTVFQKIVKHTAIFLMVALSQSLHSQDSLSHYVSLAIKTHPEVLQKYAEYRAALEKIAQAGAIPDLQVNAGILLEPMELVMGQQVAEFELMQMFPWFGTLRAAKDEMSLMANAKFEDMQNTRFQIVFDVEKTWLELFKINQYLSISNRNLNLLRTIERLSLSRYKTASPGTEVSSQNDQMPQSLPVQPQTNGSMQGMGGNNNPASVPAQTAPMNATSMNGPAGYGLDNLYKIQIEIGNLENNIFGLRNRRNALLAMFNGYLGRPALTPVFVPDTLIVADTATLLITEDSLITNNPMLRMLTYEQQSMEARKIMVTRMGYPMLGIGVNYTILKKNRMSEEPMNGRDMIMPMAAISLPLYRGKYKAMQNEAGFLSQASGYQYQAALRETVAEYYQAIQQFEDSRRKMGLIHTQITLARKSLNIQMKAFAVSGSSLTDILQTQQQLLNYELQMAEAIADFGISKAWLKRLNGKITN